MSGAASASSAAPELALLLQLIPDQFLVDLANTGLWDVLNKINLRRDGPLVDFAGVDELPKVALNVLQRGRLARFQSDQGVRALAPLLIGHTNHSGSRDRGVLADQVFQIQG